MTRQVRNPDYIDFLWQSGVITFGDFVAKSGRPTPYFVDAGKFTRASQLARLGEFYAKAVVETFGSDVDVIFGPAYKGISLAVTTGIALTRHHGLDVGVTFDRKEAKDHGEGGWLIGHRPDKGDRVVIVEDVTTAGTSIHATVPRLEQIDGVEVVGLVVGVDRQERGNGTDAALTELSRTYGLVTYALATFEEIVSSLGHVISDADRSRLETYRDAYGV